MSDQSWINEFYPVSAVDTSKEDALAHSIKKWRGLSSSNLDRHEIVMPPIEIDANTCALCAHYLKTPDYTKIDVTSVAGISAHDCSGCPLRDHLHRSCDFGMTSPFARYLQSGDPRYMITALEACEQKATR